ncbi:MAG TPA: hypothetical protein VGD69_27990 [Herpetosiphonaceae bacterium]
MRRSIIVLLMLTGLWLLTACGGESTGSAPPDSGSPGDEPGDSPATAEPIRREAECAFPAQMQVGRPATVRFSVFTAGNQPNPLPSAVTDTEPFEIPERPDLQTWVAVSLDVNGQLVSQDADRQFQRLSERSNIWVWQITPSSAEPLVLQPIVDVEYRDAEGQVVERQTSVWTQTYTVDEVVGPGYTSMAASWLGDSVSELITGMIGSLLMAGVINPARNMFTRRFGKQQV